jgi:hypothetical protein
MGLLLDAVRSVELPAQNPRQSATARRAAATLSTRVEDRAAQDFDCPADTRYAGKIKS